MLGCQDQAGRQAQPHATVQRNAIGLCDPGPLWPPRLDLDVYPFLPRTNIATTSAASYMSLLAGDEA